MSHQHQQPGIERPVFRLLGKRNKRPASEHREPVAERRKVGFRTHNSHHCGGSIPMLLSTLTASMRLELP